jgi:hypothetical protein
MTAFKCIQTCASAFHSDIYLLVHPSIPFLPPPFQPALPPRSLMLNKHRRLPVCQPASRRAGESQSKSKLNILRKQAGHTYSQKPPKPTPRKTKQKTNAILPHPALPCLLSVGKRRKTTAMTCSRKTPETV